jgi:hypothetical protein
LPQANHKAAANATHSLRRLTTPANTKPVRDKKGNIVGYINKKGDFVSKNKDLIGSFALKETTYDRHGNEIIKTKYISTQGEIEGRNSKLYRNGKFIGDTERKREHEIHKGSNIGLFILTILLICGITLGVVVHENTINEVPVIDISDENIGAWNEGTKIKVFDEKIHPGSEGKYEFIINNDNFQKIEYSVNITQFYNGEEVEDFPIVYRLKKEFLYLNGNKWVGADELKFDNLLLSGKKDQTFVLEWQWPFESGSDANDTLLGYNQGEYYISIDIQAEFYNGDK